MVRGTVAAAVLAALVLPGAAQAQPQSSLLPWPNDALTTRDKTTDTGRRLNLPLAGMPHNKDGVRSIPRT